MSFRTCSYGIAVFLLAFGPELASAAVDNATGGQGAQSAGLPQLDPTWYASEIFWLAVHFFVLYLFSARVILPKIAARERQRQDRIAEDFAAAEKMSAEARQVRLEYEAELSKARAQANKIRVDMVAACKEETQQTEAGKNAEFAQRIASAHARIEKESQEIRQKLQEGICETVQEIVQKVSGQNISCEAIAENLRQVANDRLAISTQRATEQ